MRVEWKGLEIHPELPPEGMPREMFMRGGHLRQVEENLRRLAEEAGVAMKPPEVIANTHLALEAAEFAREHGEFGLFHRRLFELYFQDGVNIGEMNALVSLAEEAGLDGSELRQALAERRYQGRLREVSLESQRYGVSGTPTFFIGSQVVVGAQPYEVLRQAALRAGARPRPD